MLRNKDIPQGIKANRFGYPTRTVGGSYVYGSERDALLRDYSDAQLNKIDEKVVGSRRGLQAIKWTSPFVSSFATGTSLLAYMAAIEQARGTFTSADSVPTFLANGFNAFSGLLEHIGIERNLYNDGLAAVGISFVAPLIVATIADLTDYSRSTMSLSIRKEQDRRVVERSIAAAIAKRTQS